MLTLKRRAGENLVLTWNGERVVVDVHRLLGGQVQLRITAPRSVTIHRGEVQARIDAELVAEAEQEGQA